MPEPTVSIILPTYNRARFLPNAVSSIVAQTYTDWELIVVDDGSTDGTDELVATLTADFQQPVRYLRQENRGAYAARNLGLDHASGEYIAFLDSDDLWLPHHLALFVKALSQNPDVDWLYAPSRRVVAADGSIRTANTFYRNGRPRSFLRLRSEARGDVRVIADERAVECALSDGLACQLPSSLIRRRVFDALRFWDEFRNMQDAVLAARALIGGLRFAYIDDVVLVCNLHDAHSSLVSGIRSFEKAAGVFEAILGSYSRLLKEADLSAREAIALRRRLARVRFWHYGYATCWEHGHRRLAMAQFRDGIRSWPWDWRLWKTYLLARVRCVLSGY